MFLKKTVDSVLVAFTKAIADLSAVAKEQRDLADRKIEEAALANTEANVAIREANRADAVKARLEAIVYDPSNVTDSPMAGSLATGYDGKLPSFTGNDAGANG